MYGEVDVILSSPVLNVSYLRDASSDSFQGILTYIKESHVLPIFARAVTLALHEVVLAGNVREGVKSPTGRGECMYTLRYLECFAAEARLNVLEAVNLPMLLLTQSSMEASS